MSIDTCIKCATMVDTDYDDHAYTLIHDDEDLTFDNNEVEVLACHCYQCRFFRTESDIVDYIIINNLEVVCNKYSCDYQQHIKQTVETRHFKIETDYERVFNSRP